MEATLPYDVSVDEFVFDSFLTGYLFLDFSFILDIEDNKDRLFPERNINTRIINCNTLYSSSDI